MGTGVRIPTLGDGKPMAVLSGGQDFRTCAQRGLGSSPSSATVRLSRDGTHPQFPHL